MSINHRISSALLLFSMNETNKCVYGHRNILINLQTCNLRYFHLILMTLLILFRSLLYVYIQYEQFINVKELFTEALLPILDTDRFTFNCLSFLLSFRKARGGLR